MICSSLFIIRKSTIVSGISQCNIIITDIFLAHIFSERNIILANNFADVMRNFGLSSIDIKILGMMGKSINDLKHTFMFL